MNNTYVRLFESSDNKSWKHKDDRYISKYYDEYKLTIYPTDLTWNYKIHSESSKKASYSFEQNSKKIYEGIVTLTLGGKIVLFIVLNTILLLLSFNIFQGLLQFNLYKIFMGSVLLSSTIIYLMSTFLNFSINKKFKKIVSCIQKQEKIEKRNKDKIDKIFEDSLMRKMNNAITNKMNPQQIRKEKLNNINNRR